MDRSRLLPVHPWEILVEEFLKPMELSQNLPAAAIGVPPRRIHEIALRKRAITADTFRLTQYFGNSPQFRPGLQMDNDLDVASDLQDRSSRKPIRVRAS